MAGAPRDDALLRTSQLVAEAVERLLERSAAGDPAGARHALRDATAMLVGHRAALLAQVDVATAANLLNDPRTIAAYAGLVAADAALADREADPARRDRLAGRAAALRAEATRRAPH